MSENNTGGGGSVNGDGGCSKGDGAPDNHNENGPEFGPEPEPSSPTFSDWYKLPLEVVLRILRYLPKQDLLNGRLVSKTFIPRNIRVAIWALENHTFVLISLNLSSRVGSDEYDSGMEFDIGRNRNGDQDPQVSGFMVRHDLKKDKKNLQDLPDHLLTKVRYLTVAIREPVLLMGDTLNDLEMIEKHCHMLKSLCMVNTEFDNFAHLNNILNNNKHLTKVCAVKGTPGDEAGPVYDWMHTMDLKWTAECHELKELTVIYYTTENVTKIPTGINHLFLQTPLGLESVLWIGQYNTELRTLGLLVEEYVFEKAILQAMQSKHQPQDAYRLVGLDEHTVTNSPPSVANIPGMMTPDLLKFLVNHLPHLENLLVDFVIRYERDDPLHNEEEGVEEDEELNQEINVSILIERFKTLKEACALTPGFIKSQFVGRKEAGSGEYKFTITLHMNRQIFKGFA